LIIVILPFLVLTKVQVTSSPGPTLIAFTGLPSLHVALVRVHNRTDASEQPYAPGATLTGPWVLDRAGSPSSSSEKLPSGAAQVKLKSWA
jgi:hypothetical protein